MKTSLELEKRLEQLQKDINIAEVELGKSLITKKMDSSFIPLYEEFEHIESQKKSYLQDIDKIRELAANGKQINNELDIIKKQSNALLSEWSNLYEKLGIALANNQNLAYTQEYEPYRIPIEEMKSKYAEAKDALDSLRVQMENQSFMNRLLSQVQYTAKNTSFSQLQKKLDVLEAQKFDIDSFENLSLFQFLKYKSIRAFIAVKLNNYFNFTKTQKMLYINVCKGKFF